MKVNPKSTNRDNLNSAAGKANKSMEEEIIFLVQVVRFLTDFLKDEMKNQYVISFASSIPRYLIFVSVVIKVPL